MRGNFAGFFSQTTQRISEIIKKGWLGIAPSQQTNICVLVAVVTLVILVVSVTAIVRPAIVRSVIWVAAVIAVATWVVAISRISVVAVSVRRVTNSNWSDPNRNLSVSLFHRNQSQSYCYQWK